MNRLKAFFASALPALFTTVGYAAANPLTGDNNKVMLAIIIIVAVVIVAALVMLLTKNK